jgi:hypothetical protein
MYSFLSHPFWKGFIGAFLGSLIVGNVLLAIHLWSDHVAFHAIMNYLNQHAAAINALPAK